MKIRNENTATVAFYNDDIMAEHYEPPGIEFNEEGVARVKKAVGEALVESEEYPTIHRYDETETESEQQTQTDSESNDMEDE